MTVSPGRGVWLWWSKKGIFFFKNTLFIWLCWVLVVARGTIHCSMQTLSCSVWGLVPWPGLEPGPPALGPQSQQLEHQGSSGNFLFEFFGTLDWFFKNKNGFIYYLHNLKINKLKVKKKKQKKHPKYQWHEWMNPGWRSCLHLSREIGMWTKMLPIWSLYLSQTFCSILFEEFFKFFRPRPLSKSPNS